MQQRANPLFLKAFSIRCRRIAFFGVALVALGGCALLRGGPSMSIPDVGGFAVKGRIAVRQADDGFAGNFLWQHAKDRDEIDLWGPIGQDHSRLVAVSDGGSHNGKAGNVTVYTAKGEVYHEPDTAAAMQRWLGFTLPIDALTHWIRGERAPQYPVAAKTFAASGELTSLDQLSWHIEFSDPHTFDADRRLPSRIVAVRGDIRITLLPAQWSFGAQNAFDTP